jgi:hypothetical protein
MPGPRRAAYRKRGTNRHRLRSPFDGRALHYWRGLGPGLVTGASDNDPSGIGTYSVAGATIEPGVSPDSSALPWARIAGHTTMALGDRFESALQAARAGADWALGALYRDLHPRVLRYLRAQDPAEAEDLACSVPRQRILESLSG